MNDKPKYNPEKHHRRSMRLQGYDYSQAGLYFITICTHNREFLFGDIANGEMIWNDMGKIANEYWLEIPNHFPNAVLHEHIVMPNHTHGIIELTDSVGASHVGTRHGVSLPDNTDNTVGTSHGMSLQHGVSPQHGVSLQPHQREFGKPIPGSVSTIINQFKSSVKRWCNKNGYEHFKWQSRFHDHIIRDEKSYLTISEYIINNPVQWQEDKFFK